MNSLLIWLILISVNTLAATLVALFIKIAFFLKRKDAYWDILKFGLLGEAFGFLIVFALGVWHGQATNEKAAPETLVAIPFVLMLAGQLAGLSVLLRSQQRRGATR